MTRDTAQRLYHRLPPFMRTAAATLRGRQLRSWRYGPETDQLVEEALDHEQWSPERWRVWEEDRLAQVLHRAATRVPYYRDHWSARRRQGDRASWECLENWPIAGKDALRENPGRFVADDRDPRRMFAEQTSGTTGKPLKLWFSREALRAWFALHEARTRRWNGVSRNDRWAILGGQAVVSPNTQRPPFWVYNRSMNQLYLSANHITRWNIGAYMDEMRKHGATHLVAYSSSAAILAREAGDLGLGASGLKVVTTNAEPLLPWQRDTIVTGLSCRVQQTYGMAEAVAAASECENGTMHVWPEAGRLEVLQDNENSPAPSGSTGRLVCTGLLNLDMPLIRYEVGDRGKFATATDACPCGRSLPTLGSIEGRTSDVLLTRNGRRVYWLNPVFYGLPIREAQIVQESLSLTRVRYTPAAGFSAVSGQVISERLQARMGDVKVILEEVDRIPRETNGKFRPVVCKVSATERQSVEGVRA